MKHVVHRHPVVYLCTCTHIPVLTYMYMTEYSNKSTINQGFGQDSERLQRRETTCFNSRCLLFWRPGALGDVAVRVWLQQLFQPLAGKFDFGETTLGIQFHRSLELSITAF